MKAVLYAFSRPSCPPSGRSDTTCRTSYWRVDRPMSICVELRHDRQHVTRTRSLYLLHKQARGATVIRGHWSIVAVRMFSLRHLEVQYQTVGARNGDMDMVGRQKKCSRQQHNHHLPQQRPISRQHRHAKASSPESHLPSTKNRGNLSNCDRLNHPDFASSPNACIPLAT